MRFCGGAARRIGAARLSGGMAAMLNDAHVVQDEALALADGQVAEWKVGKIEYDRAEVMALIDAVHVGMQVASSPFPGSTTMVLRSPSPISATTGWIGAMVERWREADVAAWPVTPSINDEEVGRATTATMLDAPFGAVRFLLAHMARRGFALEAGSGSRSAR